MKNNTIETGDYVRHKNPFINGGLRMTVEEVNEEHAKCSHFTGKESIHKVDWFPLSELELISKTEGGFIE